MSNDRFPFPALMEPEAASGGLKAAFDAVKGARNEVGSIWKAIGHHPGMIRGHLALYEATVLEGWGLSRRQCELLGTVASAVNTCRYCALHHGAPLLREGQSEEEVRALRLDPVGAALADPGDRALRNLAAKLTRDPAADLTAEMEALAGLGFDDGQRAHAVLVVAYFNMMNRIANGLAVPLEPDYLATTG